MNEQAYNACFWGLDKNEHEAHLQALELQPFEYRYNAVLWLKCVWEKNRKHPAYLNVLQGKGDVETMRREIAGETPFLKRLVEAWKEQSR